VTPNRDMTATALAQRADRMIDLRDDEDSDVTAFFTDSSEHVSDDAVNGGRYFWEYTCTLIGVDWNGDILTRDDAWETFGRAWVESAEEKAALDAEEDAQ